MNPLSLVGGIVGMAGAMSAGSSQQSLYDYQAAVAQVQEQEAEQAAWYQYSAGEAQANEQGLQGQQQLGQIKAAQGASGLQVGGSGSQAWGSSSSTDVQASAIEMNMLNELTIRNNAQWNGYQELVAANDYSNQANLDIYAGEVAKSASEVQGLSSLIGGISGSFNQSTQMAQFGTLSMLGATTLT